MLKVNGPIAHAHEPTPPQAQSVTRSRSTNTLLYLAGHGDALGAHLRRRRGADDRGELALTYSGRVLDACKQLGIRVHCIAARPDGRCFREGDLAIEEVKIPLRSSGGLWYHLGQLIHAVKIVRRARKVRPQMALISTAGHWFMYVPLSWMGVRIVPSLHNTLWPNGCRPRTVIARLTQRLNGWFWKNHVYATLVVSDECARQVRELAGELRSPIHVAVAQYPTDLPSPKPVPPRPPFRVLFAGRIEGNKGIWDVLNAAELLDRRSSGAVHWTFAGRGSDLDALQSEVRLRGLGGIVTCVGHLSPDHYLAAIDASHVVLSPTTSNFCEGLQKVAVEGILRCRPVITTRFSNALDRFGDAIEECEERSAESIASKVELLANNDVIYQSRQSASNRLRSMLFNEQVCYGSLFRRLVASDE